MEDDSEVLKNNFDRGGDPCDNNFYYFTVAVHAANSFRTITRRLIKTGGELEAKYLAMGASQVDIWKCPPKKNGGISMSITPRS